jgi:hypothetical protein
VFEGDATDAEAEDAAAALMMSAAYNWGDDVSASSRSCVRSFVL